jgi:3-deoxy-D-manno-octulosonic acid kinase
MTIRLVETSNHTLLLMPSGEGLGVCGQHFNADFLQQKKLITRTAQGRGTVYFFALSNKQLVLRHYKRGGAVAKISDDKFIFCNISSSRCYAELEVLQHLRNNKVNVPNPIAGKITRKGMFYTADIITEVISDTVELHEVLQSSALLPQTWQAIGSEIKKMHNAQVFHGDINVKNILLNEQRSKSIIHLLDFDKCTIKQGDDWKMANLMRFQRSLLKQVNQLNNYHYHQSDWENLLVAYEK